MNVGEVYRRISMCRDFFEQMEASLDQLDYECVPPDETLVLEITDVLSKPHRKIVVAFNADFFRICEDALVNSSLNLEPHSVEDLRVAQDAFETKILHEQRDWRERTLNGLKTWGWLIPFAMSLLLTGYNLRV